MMNQIVKPIVLGALLSVMAGAVTAEQAQDNHEHDQAIAVENRHQENGDHDPHEKEQPLGHDAKAEDGHEEGGHEEGGDERDAGEKLSAKQAALANIKVATLEARVMDYQVYAPGEIKANGYTSYLVSPRVDSVVLRRHATLGEHVKKGQPLVTLFSASVAEAQASYSVAQAEWVLVQKLGRKAVGERRFIAAQTNFEAAYGRLLAFGLTNKAIESLSKQSQALGEYTLIAATAGAVLTDDFQQGQRVESGDALMLLADEQELWVEARLAPSAQLQLPAGTQAQVGVGGDLFTARVTQEAHTIDPQTRTRVVRLQVNNDAHRLHPGLFTDVHFSLTTETPVLAVPESALMRGADGDWTVFVEAEPGRFKAQEVELGRSLGKWRAITGINAGTRVVFEGAFFVASQIAKGGFDPHGH